MPIVTKNGDIFHLETIQVYFEINGQQHVTVVSGMEETY